MEVGVPAFRGDADDVLERYVQCAAHFGFDCIVRATADNPGVDVEAPGRVLDALHRVRADYVHEHGLPYGAAVEGVRTEALVRAAKLTRDVFDREHVTTFVRRRTDLFAVVQLQAPRDRARPDVRLTVDTIEDLDRVRGIYQSTTAGMPSVADFIAAADRTARQSVA
jgi:spore coat polysaccharide biosynthesis protein SpsF